MKGCMYVYKGVCNYVCMNVIRMCKVSLSVIACNYFNHNKLTLSGIQVLLKKIISKWKP